jgi:hypothetical protein
MLMVEVLTGNQRRRLWSAEQKKAIVLEAEQPGMSIFLVSPQVRAAGKAACNRLPKYQNQLWMPEP